MDFIVAYFKNIIPNRFNSINVYAYLYIGVYSLLLFLFASKLHPMESQMGATPERDFYVVKIEQVVAGEIPVDAYRPLLYVFASALPALVIGDSFLGGQLISIVSSSLLLLLIYNYFKKSSSMLSLLIVTLVSLNFYYIVASVTVATDMLFACIAFLLIKYSGDTYFSNKSISPFLVSVLWGLLYFTRYTALLFLPIVIVCIWKHYKGYNIYKRLLYMALCIIATLSVLVPQMYISYNSFGSPFYNRNWQNTALRMYSNTYDYTESITQFDGYTSVILSNPLLYVKSTVMVTLDFINGRAAELLGNSGPGGLPGSILFITFLFGAFYYFNKRTSFARIKLYLLFLLLYTSGILMAFSVQSRFLLPFLPLMYYVSIEYIIKYNYRYHKQWILLLFLLLMAGSFHRLHQFCNTHPVDERDSVIWLQKHYGSEITILGSAYSLGRFTDANYQFVNSLGQDYYLELEEAILTGSIDYIVIGRASLGSNTYSFVSNLEDSLPIKVLQRDNDVTIYAID